MCGTGAAILYNNNNNSWLHVPAQVLGVGLLLHEVLKTPTGRKQFPNRVKRSSHTSPCVVHAGEYPMTGAQVAEKEVPGSKADMLHRGRNVALAFTMQVCLLNQYIHKYTNHSSLCRLNLRTEGRSADQSIACMTCCLTEGEEAVLLNMCHEHLIRFNTHEYNDVIQLVTAYERKDTDGTTCIEHIVSCLHCSCI